MEQPGDEQAADCPRPRGLLARIGVSALNILGPGLGLLRIGERRAALLMLGLGIAFPLLLMLFYLFGPELTFALFVATMAISLLFLLFVQLGSVILTFRRSRTITEPQDRWARWPMVLGATILSVAFSCLVGGASESAYRSFHIPSEAMMPTLQPGDRLVARIGVPETIRRGDLLIVKHGEHDFIKRVMALPDETVALVDGVVHINGKPLATRDETAGRTIKGCQAPRLEPRLVREFPAEGAPGHLTLDCEVVSQDNFGPIRVPDGQYFLLGDNRDRSADSRFPEAAFGLGLVQREEIVGRALFLFWSADRGRIGQMLR